MSYKKRIATLLELLIVFGAYAWPFLLVLLLGFVWLKTLNWETVITGIIVNCLYLAAGYPELD